MADPPDDTPVSKPVNPRWTVEWAELASSAESLKGIRARESSKLLSPTVKCFVGSRRASFFSWNAN